VGKTIGPFVNVEPNDRECVKEFLDCVFECGGCSSGVLDGVGDD
jgi:hypothetical protein